MASQSISEFFNNPLVDVVIGAIIGGFFSYIGVMKSTNKSIKALYAQEKRVRESEKVKFQNTAIKSITSELKQNHIVLEKGYSVAFAMMSLANESWQIYRGSINFLPGEIQNKLVEAYADISRYNSLVDYEREYVGSGREGQSVLVSKIQDQSSYLKDKITKLIHDLEF